MDFFYFYDYIVSERCDVEELDSPAASALGARSRKLSNVDRSSDGWPKFYFLELLRAS
jgi:hypothetical protein